MDAIKKIATIKNHKLVVHLPATFNHKQVEVIIMPCDTPTTISDDAAPKWQQDFLTISCWSEQEDAERIQSWPLQKF